MLDLASHHPYSMEATLTQRKYHIWASNLLFLGFALSLLFNYLTKRGYFAEDISPTGYQILYIATPIILVGYYFIRKGNIYAKTTYLALFGLVVFNTIIDIPEVVLPEFATPLKAISYSSQRIVEVSACILLILSLRLDKKKQV